MTTTIITTYRKPDAVFSTADEASADKNSKMPADFIKQIDDSFAKMMQDGIMLSNTNTWDQDTFTLTTTRQVSSPNAYHEAKTFDGYRAVELAKLAGWIFVDQQIIPD